MNQIKKSTVTPDEAMKPSYIEDCLQFVESEEMRKSLFEWLMQYLRHIENCNEIIFHAPVPLEQKVELLKSLGKYKGTEFLEEFGEYGLKLQRAIDECYNHRGAKNPASTEYILSMYKHPKDICTQFASFDEAVECIKQVNSQNDGVVFENDSSDIIEEAKINIIEKRILGTEWWNSCYIYWILNDAGEILYYEYSDYDICGESYEAPGRLRFYVPFKPGDVIITDCSPFEPAKKVVILENKDTFGSTDYDNVTCMFVNDRGNIDVGYFKLNEFLRNPISTYVSVMYRAKTYTGELTEAEMPLGIISNAIKENPELGHKIYRYVDNIRSCYNLSAPKSSILYVGANWKRLQKEFGLPDTYTPSTTTDNIGDKTQLSSESVGSGIMPEDTETTD